MVGEPFETGQDRLVLKLVAGSFLFHSFPKADSRGIRQL